MAEGSQENCPVNHVQACADALGHACNHLIRAADQEDSVDGLAELLTYASAIAIMRSKVRSSNYFGRRMEAKQ